MGEDELRKALMDADSDQYTEETLRDTTPQQMRNTLRARASVEATESKKVDRDLRKMEQDEKAVKKMLLLGAGEAGKSTIFKQARIIFKNGFTSEERESFKTPVHANCIECMKTL